MKFKILCVLILCAVFSVFFGFVFKNEFRFETIGKTEKEKVEATVKKSEPATQPRYFVNEGQPCGEKNAGPHFQCVLGLSCEDDFCVPRLDFKEIVDPEEVKRFYRVLVAGPYREDYILHVDRLVVDGKLFVWIDNKTHWFKARREKVLRPYELDVPAGSTIVVHLRRTDEFPKPEFRGRLYLTKPKKK